VVNVVAEVSDASENLVATGGPWPCTAGEGSITNVEEGTGYTITVSLRNSENVVVYHGSRSGIAVVAGMTTEVLDITLTPTNNPPAFDTDVPNQQVNETGTLTFTVSSATDPDGDILTYSAVSLPTGATFTPATRLFSWTPGYDQAGTHTATFQVTDDGTPPMSDTLSVTITVGDVNQPPVLTVPTAIQHVTETGTLTFTVSATDPDGDALTYEFAHSPYDPFSYSYLPGVTFNPATRTFRWVVPDSAPYDPTGEHRVLFRVTDDGTPRMSDYKWVTIQVYDTIEDITHRRLPIMSTVGPQRANPGELLQFTVSATDPDGGTLTYYDAPISGKNPPENYIFGDDHVFSWTPSATGNFWMRFAVRDMSDYAGYAHIDPVQEDVVITVGDVNRPPFLNPIGRRLAQNGQTVRFVVTATDPDNDTLTYSMSSPGAGAGLPANATFDEATQTFSWPLVDVGTGTYTIRFTVTDNGTPAESDYEDVSIRVQ